MSWVSVEDDLPPAKVFFMCYDDVSGTVDWCCFVPSCGWIDQKSETKRITHFLQASIPYLPRKLTKKEIEEKYDIQPCLYGMNVKIKLNKDITEEED